MNLEDINIFNQIKSKSPLSKYFDLIKPENISKSYKWYEKQPSTQVYFPLIWSEFLDVLINENLTPKSAESHFNKQTNLSEYITNGKPTGDKGWYGSTTARLFYMPDKQFRKTEAIIPRSEIIEHINVVCVEWRKSQNIHSKLLNLIEIWIDKYQDAEVEEKVSWIDITNYEKFVKEKIDNEKIDKMFSKLELVSDSKLKKYNPPVTISTGVTENIVNNNKQIGAIGENIIENILNKKYGVDSVTRTNDFDLCDFIINIKNEKYIYVEVKTSKSNQNFFISRNELEFVREKNSEYHIYFVYNVNIIKNDVGKYLLPEIKPIFDFKYRFDLVNEPYNKNGFFNLMPIKFKGKIPS